jgi:hypothetical protein
LKVYVFGGSKDDCIELANQLNGSGATALIGKDGEDIKDISGRLGRGIDCAVMISDDPIKTSVQANRDSKIRAAVCYNQKSLKSASSEDVNLFILEADAIDRLDFSVLAGGSSSSQSERAERPERSERVQRPASVREPESVGGIGISAGGLFKSMGFGGGSQTPRQKPLTRDVEKPVPKKESRKPAPVIDDEEEDSSPRSKKDGVSGTIKDLFGIED